MQRLLNVRAGLLLIIAGLIAVSGYFFYRNTPHDESIAEHELLQPVDKGVALRLSGIRLVESKEGRRMWELQARSAENRTGEELVHLRDLTIHFLSERNKGNPVIIVADEGIFNRASRDLKLWGNVQVRKSNGGAVLRTSEMVWVASTERIQTDKPVSVETRRYTINAGGLSSNVTLDHVVLEDDVQAVFRPFIADESTAAPSREPRRSDALPRSRLADAPDPIQQVPVQPVAVHGAPHSADGEPVLASASLPSSRELSPPLSLAGANRRANERGAFIHGERP